MRPRINFHHLQTRTTLGTRAELGSHAIAKLLRATDELAFLLQRPKGRLEGTMRGTWTAQGGVAAHRFHLPPALISHFFFSSFSFLSLLSLPISHFSPSSLFILEKLGKCWRLDCGRFFAWSPRRCRCCMWHGTSNLGEVRGWVGGERSGEREQRSS